MMGEIIDSFVLIEKFEELRSRSSTLRAFLNTLKQNFKSAKSYDPILPYPEGSINKLDEQIQWLEKEVVRPLDLSNHNQAIFRLSNLYYRSLNLLELLLQLQDLMEQRITGSTIHKLLDYNPNFQMEYCNMEKVYYSLDSVAYDLMQRIFFSDNSWFKKNGYVPISSFGRKGYHIFPITYQVVIPYHDIFRLRFWPILAHEMAHIWVYEHISKPIEKIRSGLSRVIGPRPIDEKEIVIEIVNGINQYNLEVDETSYFFLQSILEYINLLNKYNYGNYVSRVIAQFTEITSDIIATHVCGPCYPLAISTLFPTISEVLIRVGRPPFKINFYLDGSHPFAEARVSSSFGILKLQNIDNFDKIFQDYLTYLDFKNKRLLTPESLRFLNDYLNLFNKYTENLHEIFLENNTFDSFEATDLDKLTCVSDDISYFSKLSPVYLLNLAWIKRINRFKYDYEGNIKNYYWRKKRERKTYEIIIDHMYNYYMKSLSG